MSKQNNESSPSAFRFNQSKINSTKNNLPSTIDWNTLKKNIDTKTNQPQSLWGFVKKQQNGRSKKS